MQTSRGNYIQGRFVRPKRGVELISEDPGDLLDPIGKLIVSPEVVDAAVEAASKAFPAWRDTPIKQRATKLRAFQKQLKQNLKSFVPLLAQEVGKTLADAEKEAARCIAKVDEMLTVGLDLVASFEAEIEEPTLKGQCLFAPHGVLAVIGPFNFPAHTPLSHFVPALLLGNTVVIKPSEYAPFVGQFLMSCLDKADFPAGVVNMVQGGSDAGAALVGHPLVRGVLFTGSTEAGAAIRVATAPQNKILALEMGGKNAALVLEDANIDLAAAETAQGAFSLSGQRCNATSRILVAEQHLDAFVEAFLAHADALRVGYPLEEGIHLGPLVSHNAVSKYQKYLRIAKDEGFETLRQGKALGQWMGHRGYYVSPTVHLSHKVPKQSRYLKEEVFAPAVAIVGVKDEAQAVEVNNDVDYGLVTAVFTKSVKRFEALVPAIDTGLINWNCSTLMSSGKLPFGGTKGSGSGHPTGLFAPYYCTHSVAVLKDTRPHKARTYAS